MSDDELILYGCGSDLIVDYLEMCERNGVRVSAIINNLRGESFPEVEWVAAEEFDFAGAEAKFLAPLFTPRNRFTACGEALKRGLTPFGLLSDRNNDLPVRFEHGMGCFINRRVVIGGRARLGDFVLINRGACLGHHLVLENFVSVGPGVVTGGGVRVGRGGLVGTGAVILPGVRVGEQAIVGAGAVVTRDVEAYAVVVGNPARQVRVNENVF